MFNNLKGNKKKVMAGGISLVLSACRSLTSITAITWTGRTV